MEIFAQQVQTNYTKIDYYIADTLNETFKLTLALKYTLAGKQYNGVTYDRFKEVHQRRQSTWHEPLFINARSTIFNDQLWTHIYLSPQPEQMMDQLHRHDTFLKEAGFKASIDRNVAALFVDDQAHAIRAYALFLAMKQKQRLLTGKEDIPYAVLLTKNAAFEREDQATAMATYYEALQRQGFKQGNALQAMAQILCFEAAHYDKQRLSICIEVKNLLDTSKIRYTRRHYRLLAIICLMDEPVQAIKQVIEAYRVFLLIDCIEHHQGHALMMALTYVIQKQNLVLFTEPSKWLDLVQLADWTWELASPVVELLAEWIKLD